jgi:GTPase SAR1 family protein
VICLVYDSTSQKSFDALNFWVEEIKQRVDMDAVQIYVVASKVDNSNAEEVSVVAGNNFAKKVGAQFHQTSAKDGTGVEDLFQALADRLYLKNVADQSI